MSYRADNIVDVHCDAVDPAGEIDHVSGAAPFSVLNTPPDGWSHLWIDALDGIFDESQRPKTLGITPHLLLHVTVLPQYWLNGDFAAANQAMSRAWCVPVPARSVRHPSQNPARCGLIVKSTQRLTLSAAPSPNPTGSIRSSRTAVWTTARSTNSSRYASPSTRSRPPARYGKAPAPSSTARGSCPASSANDAERR